MQEIQNKLATDILSSEHILVLSDLSCEQDDGVEIFPPNSMTWLQNQRQRNQPKRQYGCHWAQALITQSWKSRITFNKKINQKCGGKLIPLLYFYTTANNCTECIKQGYVLTELREKIPKPASVFIWLQLRLIGSPALIRVFKVDDTKLQQLLSMIMCYRIQDRGRYRENWTGHHKTPAENWDNGRRNKSATPKKKYDPLRYIL